jgi:Bax protein
MEGKTYLTEAKWLILMISSLLIISLLILNFTRKGMTKKEKLMLIEYKTIHYINEIKDIDSTGIVPLIYDCKADFTDFPSEYRKDKFIALILPAILVVKYELMKENSRTTHIWSRLNDNLNISRADSVFLLSLIKKYQTKDLSEILKKQQVHPNSIIIAQAALESGWGTSRFFEQGNSLFGIWSYSSSDVRVNSLLPREGKMIYLKKYSTVKESVEDYFTTIANSWAYQEFREKRIDVSNPFELIWYLNQYSELRYDYVKKIGELMIQNDLHKYDTYTVSDKFVLEMAVK